jgi:hypothetical protein
MKLRLLVAGSALALLMAAPAFAAVETFTLNQVDPAAGLGSGPFGTITVTENAGALDFVETLNAGFKIHGGNGNHDAFDFDLTGEPGVTISALTSGITRESGTSFSEPPWGNFGYSLDCTGCGAGFGGGLVGPVSFKVTATSGSLSLASLGFNTVGGQNIYFSSDIVNTGGFTGNVGATLTSVTGGVPEPTSWALMILGFGGVGAMLRRRNGAAAFA